MNRPDGSVIIDTKIRTDGMKGGAADIKRQFSDIAGTARQASQEIQLAVYGGFSKSVEIAKARLESLETQFENVSDLFKDAVYYGDDKSAESLGIKREKLYDQIADARRKLEIEVTEAARKQADAEEKAAEKTRKAFEKTQRTQEKQSKTVQMSGKSMENLEKSTGRFGRRLSSIVSGALFFNVISSALSSMTRTIWSAISSTSEMKTALNNLKGAVSVATAPLVNELSKGFAVLTNSIADAFAWLASFYSLLTGKSISSMKQQAQQMNNMAAGATKAQKALAGFDEITILQDKQSGSGSSSPNYNYGLNDAEVEESVIKSVEKFKKVLEPLQKIDFTKVSKSMEGFNEASKKLSSTIGEHLGKAYEDVLVPLAEWTIEDLAPTSVDALTSAFDFLDASVDTAGDAVFAFYDETKPIWAYLGDVATGIIEKLGNSFSRFAETIKEKNPRITQAFDDLGYVVGEAYKTVEPLLIDLKDLFEFNMEAIGSSMDKMLETGIDAFADLASFIRNVFTGDFEGALESVKQGLNNWIRGSIETLNTVLMAIAVGLNKILVQLNAIEIKNPITGEVLYNFKVKPINPANWQIPIPQLASGAVIPPNAPFLAMLGDQRHGTNIEAPLSTIQDAFRAEVGEMVGGMMAGFQASLDVQEQILAAILGIEIGDTTIGEAAARYAAAQRMIRGG